jgi:hypothetical protein
MGEYAPSRRRRERTETRIVDLNCLPARILPRSAPGPLGERGERSRRRRSRPRPIAHLSRERSLTPDRGDEPAQARARRNARSIVRRAGTTAMNWRTLERDDPERHQGPRASTAASRSPPRLGVRPTCRARCPIPSGRFVDTSIVQACRGFGARVADAAGGADLIEGALELVTTIGEHAREQPARLRKCRQQSVARKAAASWCISAGRMTAGPYEIAVS